jgi:branched-chain amino acid transport system ATP-binding protein
MSQLGEVILKGEKLTKEFGGLRANSEVDFELHKGEILGLIGPNGAGKTTLVNMISGNISITSGDIFYKGKSIKGLKPYQIGRMGMARTYQIVKPFPGMTVLENISVGAMFGAKGSKRNTKEALEIAEEVIEFVGLTKYKEDKADVLNVASRKRLEIAKALAMGPEIIFFDEVMAGLNPGEIDAAIELILKIRESGITLLVIEHVMKVIKAICDNIFVLHHGEKIADGKPEEVLNDETVIKAYLGKRYKQLTA